MRNHVNERAFSYSSYSVVQNPFIRMKYCWLINFVANDSGEETDNTAKFDDKRHLIGIDISKIQLTLSFLGNSRESIESKIFYLMFQYVNRTQRSIV